MYRVLWERERERGERDFKFLVRILWLYFRMIFKFEFIDIILIYSINICKYSEFIDEVKFYRVMVLFLKIICIL